MLLTNSVHISQLSNSFASILLDKNISVTVHFSNLKFETGIPKIRAHGNMS